MREPPRRWPPACQPFQAERKRPAGKTPSPRGLEHFVAAALPEIPTSARKLGDKISLTDVARGSYKGLRCTRSLSAVVPPVRFGRVSQGASLKVFFGCGGIAAGARTFHSGGAPKSICARPRVCWCSSWLHSTRPLCSARPLRLTGSKKRGFCFRQSHKS
jgi:hypothetical protein